MAYSVQYGSSRYDAIKRRKLRWGWAGVAIVLLAVLVLQTVCPAEMIRFRQAAFPFFTPEVQSSFAEMAKDMREGSAPSDAIKVFCEDVFRDASD